MTGYKTFYESNDYHIINHRGKNNFHEMSVQTNQKSLKPFKRDDTHAMGFQQYSDRPAINRKDIKNNSPNPKRFLKLDFFPEEKTGVGHKPNFKLEKVQGRFGDPKVKRVQPPPFYEANTFFGARREDLAVRNFDKMAKKGLELQLKNKKKSKLSTEVNSPQYIKASINEMFTQKRHQSTAHRRIELAEINELIRYGIKPY